MKHFTYSDQIPLQLSKEILFWNDMQKISLNKEQALFLKHTDRAVHIAEHEEKIVYGAEYIWLGIS